MSRSLRQRLKPTDYTSTILEIKKSCWKFCSFVFELSSESGPGTRKKSAGETWEGRYRASHVDHGGDPPDLHFRTVRASLLFEDFVSQTAEGSLGGHRHPHLTTKRRRAAFQANAWAATHARRNTCRRRCALRRRLMKREGKRAKAAVGSCVPVSLPRQNRAVSWRSVCCSSGQNDRYRIT